jgi:membrane protein DedA with SNARE-associated domain
MNDLTDLVTDIIEALGPVGVAILVAIENVFPPIPSEVVLPLAGFVAGRGDASFIAMVLGATVGSVVGAWILYGIAAAVGAERLHRFVARYGRWFGLKPHDLERAEVWFDRRSSAAVLVGRCIPLIRSIVSIPAGFRRMPFVRFTVLTAIGSAVWNLALISAGAILGERWERVGSVVGLLQGLVIIVIVALLAIFIWKRFLKARLTRAGDLPPSDAELDALDALDDDPA